MTRKLQVVDRCLTVSTNPKTGRLKKYLRLPRQLAPRSRASLVTPPTVMATDIVPLIDAQTAAILASVNKYSIQQHVRVCDNCIEVPNTYTIYNLETNQAIIRVEEESDDCTRCFCAPAHSLILRFHALDPAGNPLFPGESSSLPW